MNTVHPNFLAALKNYTDEQLDQMRKNFNTCLDVDANAGIKNEALQATYEAVVAEIAARASK